MTTDRAVLTPSYTAPLVSVVIPVYNQWPVTHRCLMALESATTRVDYELVVVDDASTDETEEMLRSMEGLTVVRNPRNVGFLASCNRGAACARGEYITFLNNDTEPTSGWLDEAVLVFRNFADVGLVGSKLVYPDGRLQDAGGIIWSNGEPWNFGRNQDPDLPEFCCTRQADYVTGASMTIDRDVWRLIGGFSEEFSPAYWEDTDLAFKVRLAGRKVVYAPLSVVVHHEGASHGTAVTSGTKRYQAINEPLFKAKWSDAYATHPGLGSDPRLAASHRGTRFRVLFLAAELPRLDDFATGYEAIQEVRLLQSLGGMVTLLAAQQPRSADAIRDLQRIGIEVLAGQGDADLGALLERRGPEFDLIYVEGMEFATLASGRVRLRAPRAKVLVKLTDADVRGWKGDQRRGPDHDHSSQTPPSAAIWPKVADVILGYPCTIRGAAHHLRSWAGPVAELPWVADVEQSSPSPIDRHAVVFVGDSDDEADRSFVEFLCHDVMPLVRERRPSTPLRIHGPGWRDTLGRLFGSVDCVNAGSDAGILEALSLARVAVSPSPQSCPVWRRVIWGLSCGVPQVVAPTVTGLQESPAFDEAGSPNEWATRIVELCSDDTDWTARAAAALGYAQGHFSMDRARTAMRDALALSGVEVSGDTTGALVATHCLPPGSL